MKILRIVLIVSLAALSTSHLWAMGQAKGERDREVNIYSYRQAFLIEPFLQEFTKETGIKVNVVYLKTGLVERMNQEGKQSPADLILTVDISRISELVKNHLTQAVNSAVLESNIPKAYRDVNKQWFGLTLRARAIYSSKERVGRLPASFDYKDLADPKWENRICTRSGKHPYNVSLVASMLSRNNKETVVAWLKGLKRNLARKPQGSDRAQVQAISQGLCDLSLGNSYYYGKMLTNPEQKEWAESVFINFPGQESYGTHVNLSGMAMAAHAPNRKATLMLMEFLSGEIAQEMYSKVNYEYPVKLGVPVSQLVGSWGDFKRDDLSLSMIADNYDAVYRLLDEVEFDF